jgi:hypothetical protein
VLTFDWEAVNEPIPDEVFALDGMALPQGTRIANEKLGTGIMEGKVGEDPMKPVRPVPGIAWRSWWVLGNVVLIVVIAVVWAWRRKPA